jgi:hypothetical protein
MGQLETDDSVLPHRETEASIAGIYDRPASKSSSLSKLSTKAPLSATSFEYQLSELEPGSYRYVTLGVAT